MLGEMADSSTGRGNIQDELDKLAVSESKKMLRNKTNKLSTIMGICQKDTEAK